MTRLPFPPRCPEPAAPEARPQERLVGRAGAGLVGRLAARLPVLVLAAMLAAVGSVPAKAATLAVAPLSDRQGDPEAAQAADSALRDRLARDHDLVDPDQLRSVLRRGRIRVVDEALPEEVRELARAAGADRVLSFTLHQAERRQTPRLALSGRAYDGATGELLWAGFEAESGLDGRTLLGLGVVDDMGVLAERAADRLARDFLDDGEGRRARPSAAELGPVALLPFGSVTDAAGTNAAETLTEVTRAVLDRHGATQVVPSRVARVLRQHRWTGWGGVDDATRRTLARDLGARWIVTGGVERYDVSGNGEEPEPRVAVAVRLVDAATGRIVWMGGRERDGWDGQGPFRIGRVYSRGDLAQSLVESMVRRLLQERAGETQANARTSP